MSDNREAYTAGAVAYGSPWDGQAAQDRGVHGAVSWASKLPGVPPEGQDRYVRSHGYTLKWTGQR